MSSHVERALRGAPLVIGLVLACSPPAPVAPDGPATYRGVLLPVSPLPHDIQWRQRVTAHWAEGTRSFEAVLSKRGSELQLLGLGPMGSVGFVLRLAGASAPVGEATGLRATETPRVEFDNHSPLSLPFDPRYILLDVQRVFFPWLGRKSADAEQAGWRSGSVGRERIEERFEKGRLVQRRFRHLDDAPHGEIVVRYEGWEVGRDAPRRALLENGWYGYSLEIETLTQQRL